MAKVSFGPDIHWADYGMALLNWIIKANRRQGVPTVGIPARRSLSQTYLSYSIYQPGDMILNGYPPGEVRRGPIESDTTRYPLGGISSSVLLSSGPRANSYAARWLSAPASLLPS